MDRFIKEFTDFFYHQDTIVNKNEVCGAKQKEIDRLESIVGFDLPIIYKEFLLQYGHSDQLLSLYNGRMTIDISEMIDYNEEWIEDFDQPKNTFSFVFAIMETLELELCLNYSSINEDPKVVAFCNGSSMDIIAESFSKFIFQRSFRQTHKNYRGSYSFLLNDESIVEDVFSKATNYGFDRLWFSDSYNYYGMLHGDKAMFLVEKLEGNVNHTIFLFYKEHQDIERFLNQIRNIDVLEVE